MWSLVGVSLSEPHSTVEKKWYDGPCTKNCSEKRDCNTRYGDSYTNKHDKRTDTSIQVLSNIKISGFIH